MPKVKRVRKGKWIKADAVRVVGNPPHLEVKRMTKKKRAPKKRRR